MDSEWNQYNDRNGKGIKQIFTNSTQKMSTLSAQSIALFMSELENLHANCLSSFISSVAGAIKELANASSRIRVQASSKLRSCIQWKDADKKNWN